MKTCGFHQFVLNWSIDSDVAAPVFTRAHMGSCAECQRWQTEQKALSGSLETKPATANLSPYFTQKVMQQIESTRERSAALPWLGFATAGGILIATVILAIFMHRAQRPETSDTIAAKPESTIQLSELLPPVSTDAIKSLPAKLDEPLEKELNSVINDTKNALSSVATTFLPDGFLDQR